MDKNYSTYLMIYVGTIGLIWFIIETSIIQRLKKYHFTIYQELGEPNFLKFISLKESQIQNFAIKSFVKTNAYKTLNDDKLNNLCKSLKILKNLYALIVIAFGVFYVLPDFYYMFSVVMKG